MMRVRLKVGCPWQFDTFRGLLAFRLHVVALAQNAPGANRLQAARWTAVQQKIVRNLLCFAM
jgi:hypothetical protein